MKRAIDWLLDWMPRPMLRVGIKPNRGTHYIEERHVWIEPDDGPQYVSVDVSVVWMTRRAFRRLPDFSGF